jgi:CubicO group peptidase (beta-lactamase class C family)
MRLPGHHVLVSIASALLVASAEAPAQSGGGNREGIPSLIRALADSDAVVRENAAEALGKYGPEAEPAILPLIQLLSDRDPFVNGRAADALSRIGKGSVPSLIHALRDGETNVRWCAAIALGKIGTGAQEAVPMLAGALRDSDDNVRWSAAVALGSMRTHAREAIPALIRCLHDRDEDVRRGADMALDEVDPGRCSRTPDWRLAVAAIDSLTPALMSELHVPGVSIAVIHDRAVVWSGEYGIADVSRHTPVTRETLFEAASMTKPVFTYTVMKLVEQGKIDLDRPLTEYLNDRPFPDQPSRSLITARMVLTHTGGFPNWRKGGEERDGPLPVINRPGSRFSYSGEGIFYLQRVVEKITGEPIAVLAKRTLFDPMGLVRTTYVWTRSADRLLAAGHATDGTFLMKTRYTHANAAYTLYTTPGEYAAFLVEILKTDRSAPYSLSRESVGAMLGHHVAVDARGPIGRPAAAKGLDVFWGLGWSINSTEGGDIIHHSGANGSGFRCFSQFSPGRGTGIVIMTNGVRGDDLWARLIASVGDI